jgi:hypothetical protein
MVNNHPLLNAVCFLSLQLLCFSVERERGFIYFGVSHECRVELICTYLFAHYVHTRANWRNNEFFSTSVSLTFETAIGSWHTSL